MEGVWGGGPGPLERPTGADLWRLATANEQMTSDCNNMELTKWTRPDGSNTSWLPRAPRCSYSFSSAPARGAATTGGKRATAGAVGCSSSSSEVDAEGVAGREQGEQRVWTGAKRASRPGRRASTPAQRGAEAAAKPKRGGGSSLRLDKSHGRQQQQQRQQLQRHSAGGSSRRWGKSSARDSGRQRQQRLQQQCPCAGGSNHRRGKGHGRRSGDQQQQQHQQPCSNVGCTSSKQDKSLG